jgi:hypothetical protein
LCVKFLFADIWIQTLLGQEPHNMNPEPKRCLENILKVLFYFFFNLTWGGVAARARTAAAPVVAVLAGRRVEAMMGGAGVVWRGAELTPVAGIEPMILPVLGSMSRR